MKQKELPDLHQHRYLEIINLWQGWKPGVGGCKARAVTKARKMDKDFKIRLIKLYRCKLEKAFNQWRVNRSAMVIEI